MGTLATIAILRSDNTVRSITCSSDGDIPGVGKMLVQYYTTLEHVRELIGLGDLSRLGENIGYQHDAMYPTLGFCVALFREHGKLWDQCRPSLYASKKAFENAVQHCEYSYLYSEKEQVWRWKSPSKKVWRKLTREMCGLEASETPIKTTTTYFTTEKQTSSFLKQIRVSLVESNGEAKIVIESNNCLLTIPEFIYKPGSTVQHMEVKMCVRDDAFSGPWPNLPI